MKKLKVLGHDVTLINDGKCIRIDLFDADTKLTITERHCLGQKIFEYLKQEGFVNEKVV